jgi:hypothetical protein
LYRATHKVVVIDDKNRGSVSGRHSLASNPIPGNWPDGTAAGKIYTHNRSKTQLELEAGAVYPQDSNAVGKKSKDCTPFIEAHGP